MVHHPGDLVGGSNLCLGRADTGLQPAIEGAKGTVALRHRSRRLQERLSGPIVALAGRGADDLTACDLVVGGQLEPGAEMLLCWESAHIGADFADDLLGEVETEAIHGGEVNAGDAAQVLADVHGALLGEVLAVRTALVGRERFLVVGTRVGPVGADGGVGALDFEVAGLDLAGIEVVEFEGLLEDEEVLFAPGLP